jgi:hypothetical protein
VLNRIDVASRALVPLTQRFTNRNLSLARAGGWILLEAGRNTLSPALMPAEGGGIVFLDPSRSITFTSPLSTDDTGQRVVFSGTIAGAAQSQVLGVEMSRDLRVFPRAVPGGPLNIELPAAAGETGFVFASLGVLADPLVLPGFVGGFYLDPAVLVLLLSGLGNGSGPIRTTIGLPSDPGIAGVNLYLQGVRLLTSAELTRYVELQIL